jgi:putative spermidine/putrescine transport system permease protein
VTGAPTRLLRAGWFAALATLATVPLAVLAVRSVAREWFFPAPLPAVVDAGAWTEFVSGRLGAALAGSLGLGAATGILAAAAGFPAGRAMAELAGWRRAVAAACAFLPVAVPPVALATGLHVTFLGLGLAGTAAGVLLAHLVPAIGYTSLYFLGVFTAYDARLEGEARTLGASRLQVLRYVTLPLLRRPFAEAAVLGFLTSWAQVPLTLLIGGGAVRTLATEVLAYVQAGQDRHAAAGALLLVIPALAVLAVVALAVRRTEAVAL